MLRLHRPFLLVLIAAFAAPFALAQPTIYTPTSYVAPSMMGTDGNLYGSNASGMFQINLATDAYSIINATLVDATLCSIVPNGSFLALNGNTVQYVNLAGAVTNLATLPYSSVCPVLANDGNYYGGLNSSGAYGDGYLYQLTPAGKVTVLYNFTGGADGFGPATPMLQGSDGNLYGVGRAASASTGEMFRFTAADGLTAYSSTAGISGPLYETSSGTFSAIGGSTYYTITPQGEVTSTALSLNGDPNATDRNGNLFLGGDGYLYLEEYYDYYNFEAPAYCGIGNYMSVFSLGPGGTPAQGLFTIGYDEYDDYSGDSYTLNEFLAGNGTFYGGYADYYTYFDDNEGFCANSGTNFAVYAEPEANAAPLSMTLTANRLIPGGSTTVSWDATSAFADSLKECYGYNGLSGKVASTGSQKLAFAQAGTYTPSIVCGGAQTGIAPVIVGGTTLILSASPAYVYTGHPVTLTAAIANPGSPAPTGSVQFIYAGKVIATSSINSSGVATLAASTTGLPTGSYPITAKYLGNSNYTAAASSPVTVAVMPLATTTTTLTTTTPTLLGGQTASFSVTVSNSGVTYSPSGTVTLYLGTTALLSGTLSGTVASISASTAGVAPGTYSLTEKYSGDAYNAPSTSSAVTVTVQKGVTITVSAMPNPVPTGDAFTLTAKVTGNSSTPTGTVIFSAGSQELAGANLANGAATANIPANTLVPGTYSITAAYAGDSKNPSGTSTPYSLTVD